MRHTLKKLVMLTGASLWVGQAHATPLPSTSPDPILFWNQQLLTSIRTAATAPPPAARAMALVHTAMYDAVNAANGAKFRAFTPISGNHSGADANTAAAVAAHQILTTLFPAQQAQLNAALQTFLLTSPNTAATAAGSSLGQLTANTLLTARASDGANSPASYSWNSAPGQWQSTNGTSAIPAFQQYADVTPWMLDSGDQFRPEAAPALDSAAYAAAYNEVQSLGALNSTTRTADQTAIAFFWRDGGGTATPPGHWLQIAQDIAEGRNNSVMENARLFATLAIGVADAAIASWDAKNFYNFWRPETGIHSGGLDGNPLTAKDDFWKPLIATPYFQSYTSGHSTFSGAASQVLDLVFAPSLNAFPFCVRSEVNSAESRCYTSFADAAEEAGMSRIYGGIHWQFDNVAGLAAGRNVGQWAYDHFYAPEPGVLGLAAMGVILIGASRVRRRA